MSAINATQPALGEFGIEEEDGAEKAEAEVSEDGGEASDEDHSGPETAANYEAAAKTDKSEDESEIDECNDAAGEVDDVHNEKR